MPLASQPNASAALPPCLKLLLLVCVTQCAIVRFALRIAAMAPSLLTAAAAAAAACRQG